MRTDPGDAGQAGQAGWLPRWVLLVGLVLLATAQGGCRSAGGPELGVGTAWRVRQGQAVWRPKTEGPEIAGELTVAIGASGEYLIEFAKPALPLVRVVRQGERWEIAVPGRGRRSGTGIPPSAVAGWMRLGDLLTGRPLPAPWRGESGTDGGDWSVENPRTGERIEGFLSP